MRSSNVGSQFCELAQNINHRQAGGGKFSVVIPAYNAEKYIIRLLDSLRAAKSEPLEIVIIDDGSTDNTANIVEEYRRNHQELDVILHRQSNKGVSSARNVGIGIAHGDYIWFVDADDEINPSCVSFISQLCKCDYDITPVRDKK